MLKIISQNKKKSDKILKTFDEIKKKFTNIFLFDQILKTFWQNFEKKLLKVWKKYLSNLFKNLMKVWKYFDKVLKII